MKRFPFDWNNPIGYLIAFVIQYIIIAYEFCLTSCALAVGIGSLWLAILATKDIRRILNLINDKAQTNVIQSNDLIDFIEAHGAIKQLSRSFEFSTFIIDNLPFPRVEHVFSEILQPIILSLFTWSLVIISSALLFIQVELVKYTLKF